MRVFSTAATACTIVLGLLATTNAADQPPDAKTGLKVGTKAPAFKLKDQDGKERELDEFLLAKFSKASKITYPLLSDVGSKTIGAYDLLNKEAKGTQAGIPYPGTMVVDQQGVIRAKLFLEGIKERHATEALVKAVKEIK